MDEFEIFMNQQEDVMEIISYVEEKIKEKRIEDFMVKSMISMLFDVLFKEDSVEVAEEICDAVKKVNEELGTLK